jgi:lipopolysaccharide export system protein LptA
MMARLTQRPALAALALVLATALAAAQEQKSPMQGFAISQDQPVKIEAQTLEVRDKQRQATFSGGVTLTQGDTVLKCRTLVVFYEDTAAASSKKGAPPQGAPQAQKGGSGQQIKRAEARGEVFVTQKDQTASGDNGVYDLKGNTITLNGNVVVTQGPNVMKGERMVVELTTGRVTVESGKSGGGVQMLVMPSAAKDPAPAAKDARPAPASAPAKDAKAAQPQPAKSAPRGPIKIN